MKMITLTNQTQRMRSFVLPHEIYCEAVGRCFCFKGRHQERSVPWSLTIPADGKARHLPEAVLEAPDIAKAVKAGELSVRHEPSTRRATTKRRTRKRNKKEKVA